MPITDTNKIEKVYCDGDIWNYRIGFRSQHEPDQPPAPWFTVKWSIHETMDKVQQRFPSAQLIVCMTDEKNNYRMGVAKTKPYKGTRHLPKPYWWRRVRDYFLGLGTKGVPGGPTTSVSVNEEADDLMSKALIADPQGTAIVTEDKDLLNTPGVHWNDKTGRLVNVTPAQANRSFYKQLLTGDGVDNIPGCPRIGAIKADGLLQRCRTPAEYERVIGLAYACAKGVNDPEAMMIEMGQLLWMRRVDDEMWDLVANGFSTPRR